MDKQNDTYSIKYRNLSKDEITLLESQGCINLDTWNDFYVSNNFTTKNIKNTTFSGVNHVASQKNKLTLKHNIKATAGIYNAQIHNCRIGKDVFIQNIGNIITNYDIEEGVQIVNTNELICDELSTFGNGVKVNAVNEAGGRDITIYNGLSAQTAFLLCFYKHNNKLITELNKAINSYCNNIKSNTGLINKNAQIYNSGSIINVNIGESAFIDSVSHLQNGTINSSSKAVSYIGKACIVKNFISSYGSSISNTAQLNECFIGEACEIGGGFSAENSVFFANSQFLLGEACSIFAGPYTVSHHKSTLLIAGNFSFFNAGSATNQSNHMYKLGPVHQGIMERGCKTGSGSYVLWPAKIGAFTMILGKHYNNPDTSIFPFSYLIEDNGKSILMPGQNMFTAGTTRDIEKWPQRDKRCSSLSIDTLNYSALNPFTINKVIDGITVLKQLLNKAKVDTKTLLYKNTVLTIGSIKRGIKLYEQILKTYIGDIVSENYSNNSNPSTDIRSEVNNKWIDLSGLIIREDKLDRWIDNIIQHGIKHDNINTFYKTEDKLYSKECLRHAILIANNYFNINLNNKNELISFLEDYTEVLQKNKISIIVDAKKEFKTKTGFGIYGDQEITDADFENVRGNIQSNKFIQELESQYKKKEEFIVSLIKSL